MDSMLYVGMDVHKKTVAWCAKRADGTLVGQGTVEATRAALRQWAGQLPGPWHGAMEATLFTGWIYDTLAPLAARLEVANPLRVRAIATAKRKNDQADAATLADLLRANLLPACQMLDERTREMRRLLRFRNMVVHLGTRMKNKISGLLMETGSPYDGARLHGKAYFAGLIDSLEDVPESVIQMLRHCRTQLEVFQGLQRSLLSQLHSQPELAGRVERLRAIKGVGPVLALTWCLEIGDPARFGSIRKAISYCGLCSAQRQSAGKDQRGPLSKQRNKHLQWVLIEAAHLAPRFNPALAALQQRERARNGRHRATLAVARKLVAYLMAADRTEQPFENKAQAALTAAC